MKKQTGLNFQKKEGIAFFRASLLRGIEQNI